MNREKTSGSLVSRHARMSRVSHNTHMRDAHATKL